MKRLVLSCTLFVLALSARSQTPIVAPDLSVASRVSPAYFGPNAFPVPDVPDGRVQKDIYAEFAADFYQGTLSDGSDYTYDAFLRVRFPLFSRRIPGTVDAGCGILGFFTGRRCGPQHSRRSFP